MSGLQAASIYLAIQMILALVLAYKVAQKRHAGIDLGDGGDLDMQRRIRIHGNLVEYAPMFFLGLFALVALGAPVAFIHGFGIVFTLARLGHAFNFNNKDGRKGVPMGRFFWNLVYLAIHIGFGVFFGLFCVDRLILVAVSLGNLYLLKT